MTITLATLPQSTAQEVFDQVVAHLSRQGEACYLLGTCQYHRDDLRCAAGCLIAPSEYKPSMERHVWKTLVASEMVPDTHRNLIMALQSVHDNNNPDAWSEMLQAVAFRFKLIRAECSDHTLKCFLDSFDSLYHKRKRADIRQNDRDFKVGQEILYQEGAPTTEGYSLTGRWLRCEITDISTDMLPPRVVMLSLAIKKRS